MYRITGQKKIHQHRHRVIYKSQKSFFWLNVLDKDRFFLANKSCIVNIDRVVRFTDKHIELKGAKEPIDLSREKKNAFKQKMLLYLAGQE